MFSHDVAQIISTGRRSYFMTASWYSSLHLECEYSAYCTIAYLLKVCNEACVSIVKEACVSLYIMIIELSYQNSPATGSLFNAFQLIKYSTSQ